MSTLQGNQSACRSQYTHGGEITGVPQDMYFYGHFFSCGNLKSSLLGVATVYL